jgi:hypothetical protein
VDVNDPLDIFQAGQARAAARGAAREQEQKRREKAEALAKKVVTQRIRKVGEQILDLHARLTAEVPPNAYLHTLECREVEVSRGHGWFKKKELKTEYTRVLAGEGWRIFAITVHETGWNSEGQGSSEYYLDMGLVLLTTGQIAYYPSGHSEVEYYDMFSGPPSFWQAHGSHYRPFGQPVAPELDQRLNSEGLNLTTPQMQGYRQAFSFVLALEDYLTEVVARYLS